MPRRFVAPVVAALLLVSAPALAERTHTIGLGYRQTNTPIGARWWITPRVGADIGFGLDASKESAEVDTNDDGIPDVRITDTLAEWTLNMGAPWAAWSNDYVRVLLRPGFEYHTEDDFDSFLATGGRVKLNSYAVTGEVEVELNVWKDLTISASHGVEFRSNKLDVPGAESFWTAGTTGTDFFRLGFFVYLWGAAKQP
jgi:hypothetical protein